MKLLDTGIIYPIADSPWVSPIHYVPKKGGIIVVTNKNDELVLTRTVTGWRVCIDYRKLNEATTKDHFPLPFMDQMLERLARNKYFCFLDGFSGYFQIPIDPNDQEKTTFTCPFGTYAYRRMPFGLCNAPATFQRCMLAIFHDMIEESVEVFMDDFSVFENSFDTCLNNLDKMLQRCKDAHLVLNWEKCHFMVKEGIVLGHKVSSAGLEVDKAKINIKNTPFEFDDECRRAFESLKEKLTCAPVINISPPKDAETPVESPIPISPSSSVGSSSPARSTIPPPDYPFDKSIFADLDNLMSQMLMPPKITSTSAAPAMTQAVIRQLVADSIAAALEAQRHPRQSDNPNRNTGPR
ncbi:reverse transcriptase domain-containing protein [Tanacetum coccineum]